MRIWFSILFLLAVFDARAAVVSSLQPIDLVVQDLLGTSDYSQVLITGQASPHHYSLKLSDMKKLLIADLLIWVGPELETFLQKPLKKRTKPTLELSKIFSTGGDFHTSHDHHHKHDSHGEQDAHLWLSYENATKFAERLAPLLTKQLPQYEQRIFQNLKAFRVSMSAEKERTAALFSELSSKGFGVYHDGYSAYVEEFGLNQLAFVTVAPDEQISFKRLATIKRKLEKAQCLLGEKSEIARVQKLATKLELKAVGVDLLATNFYPAKTGSQFAAYMRNIRRSFLTCLGN